MSSTLKEFGRQFGLGKRLMFAFLGLFAPATMLVCVVKAFLKIVEDLSPEELQKLIEEIKDV
jgi:hypothetical protein